MVSVTMLNNVDQLEMVSTVITLPNCSCFTLTSKSWCSLVCTSLVTFSYVTIFSTPTFVIFFVIWIFNFSQLPKYVLFEILRVLMLILLKIYLRSSLLILINRNWVVVIICCPVTAINTNKYISKLRT